MSSTLRHGADSDSYDNYVDRIVKNRKSRNEKSKNDEKKKTVTIVAIDDHSHSYCT